MIIHNSISLTCSIVLLFALLIIRFLLRLYSGRHERYRRKAGKVLDKLQKFPPEYPGKVIAYLRKINPYVFEELLLMAFAKRGYKTFTNRRYSGDGGIDGKVEKNGELYYIQAKRYKNYVNAGHVRDFSDLCMRDNVKGFFIHTGKTGRKSRRLVFDDNRIQVISGRKLIDLLCE